MGCNLALSVSSPHPSPRLQRSHTSEAGRGQFRIWARNDRLSLSLSLSSFYVAPDVTRFGQEIGSIIVAVAVVVIIADLQQKTASPKIELQTVKKGEGGEGGGGGGRRSFDHQQKWRRLRQRQQKGLVRHSNGRPSGQNISPVSTSFPYAK